MKATDLMIGDFVEHDNVIKRVNVIWGTREVSLNDPSKIYGSIYSDKFLIEEIKPIPLTREILEKNGFDVSDKEIARYNFEENGEKLHFSLRAMYDRNGFQKGWSFFAFNVLTILDYIHELQHALRLCGIKKEIEL